MANTTVPTAPAPSGEGMTIPRQQPAQDPNAFNKWFVQNNRSPVVNRDISGGIVDETSSRGLDWLAQHSPSNLEHRAMESQRFQDLANQTGLQSSYVPPQHYGGPGQPAGMVTPYGTASIHQPAAGEALPTSTITENGRTTPMSHWFATHPDTSGVTTGAAGKLGIGNVNATTPAVHDRNLADMLALPHHGQEIGAVFSHPHSAQENRDNAIVNVQHEMRHQQEQMNQKEALAANPDQTPLMSDFINKQNILQHLLQAMPGNHPVAQATPPVHNGNPSTKPAPTHPAAAVLHHGGRDINYRPPGEPVNYEITGPDLGPIGRLIKKGFTGWDKP